MPALRDRAIIEFSLDAMTPLDVHRMVRERLRRAGRQGDLFAPSAVQLIYQRAGGMPRRVTILCLLSMWFAYRHAGFLLLGLGAMIWLALSKPRPHAVQSEPNESG